MLKTTVLDPQGQTIQRALGSLGYAKVQDVRQGNSSCSTSTASAAKKRKRRSRAHRQPDVLTNPVIEQYRYEILEA